MQANTDVPVQGPHSQGHGISGLAFKQTMQPVPQEIAVASSWDKNVYVYQISVGNANAISGARHVTTAQHPAPTLDVAFGMAGTAHSEMFFTACADKSVKMVQNYTSVTALGTGSFQAPVSCVRTTKVNNTPMVIAGSWDRSIKFFDARQPNPTFQVQCSERVYKLDAREQMMAVVTADRKISIFNLQNPQKPVAVRDSPLKQQIRAIACFTNGQGFLVGSIEGRVGVQYMRPPPGKKNFAFKCHRSVNNGNTEMYAVNDIKFNRFGTLATVGGDGMYNFWDYDKQKRLSRRAQRGQIPISCCNYNSAGTLFAYAESYDWHMGMQGAQRYPTKNLMIRSLKSGDIKMEQK